MSTHVVFGFGQVGAPLAEELVRAGHEVRVVTRSPQEVPAGAEHRAGDATDPSFVRRVAEGARALYHCVNVPYQQWYTVLPAVNAALTRAARDTGARLVVLDNLYALGRPDAAMREDTPEAPRAQKGELRARLARELLALPNVAVLRAPDFFGPRVAGSAVFHPMNLKKLVRGKRIDIGGDPAQAHSYAYAPDVARALRALGTAERLDHKLWHAPIAFQGTTRELVREVGAALGVPGEVGTMPGWMWTVGGLFSPFIREAAEMVYQWEGPFVVDDAKIRAFGVAPTPRAEAVAATAAWIKRAYPA